MLKFPLPPSLIRLEPDPRSILVTLDGATLVRGGVDDPNDFTLTDRDGYLAGEDREDEEDPNPAAVEVMHLNLGERFFRTAGMRATTLVLRRAELDGDGVLVWDDWIYAGEKYYEETAHPEDPARAYFRHTWVHEGSKESFEDDGGWR